MNTALKRRSFIQVSTLGIMVFLDSLGSESNTSYAKTPTLISPGCRTSKVKIAKLYLGKANALWPTPTLDIHQEMQMYEDRFAAMREQFSDIEFVTNALVTSVEQVQEAASKIEQADGILIVHLSMGIHNELNRILEFQKPTVLFAAPYSGHEWASFGELMKRKEGALLDCILSADYKQLAEGIRPLRAIHHLREAKILNVTERDLPEPFVQAILDKFGTRIVKINRQRTMEAYDSIPDPDAKAEAKRWIEEAVRVVEPPEDEIFRSCKLALAFEKLMNEEAASVITADCYGTMYHNLPAFPCIGFVRLNDMGLGGICESDLRCAMTHIIMQSLSGKPGFISDPTFDTATNSAILAHCLGSTKMDGPDGARAPYQLRTIMERQEGAVPQVRMRIGQPVTQAILAEPDSLLYFTGNIIETPEGERGCRTKITVKVDGDAERLWKNWTHGLHRVTCYGDITSDLKRLCRFKQIEMIDEVA